MLIFLFFFLLYGRVAPKSPDSILFYSPFLRHSLTVFTVLSLAVFFCLPVKQSELTLILLPALSSSDESEKI